MNRLFKGKGRTIADSENKPKAPQPAAPQPASGPMQLPPEITGERPAPPPEEMPGPGKRFMRVTKTPEGQGIKPCEEKDDFFKVKSSDLNLKNYGQPKTFADVRKTTYSPKIAKIKFDIRSNKVIFAVEAQFAINETIDAVYDFLLQQVFEKVEKIEIFTSFPRALLPRDGKHLAGLKIQGNVLLNVAVTGGFTLKI